MPMYGPDMMENANEAFDDGSICLWPSAESRELEA